MSTKSRRKFLRLAAQSTGAAAALMLLPPSIRKALAVPAAVDTSTINDVKHIVILMQENRSFDHYFGTLRGVRGFGDRFPIPLESGKSVWFQSNGEQEIPPFHFDEATMNAALIIDCPHNFPDMQGAWNQGKSGFWPKYKTDTSMGYYKRAEAPFQYALADAFTICDGYHCSLTTGTDPNRVVFWSGSNYDPARREAGLNSDPSNAEIVNIRCWISGEFPTPGYTYYGSALPWKTIPEVLEDAGISWRIYQDPNDNWTGAMNGANAFAGFRNAQPGSSIYENGLAQWTLDDLKKHVVDGTLPAVSWVCPSQLQSEHPAGPSSPARGGDFTQQVLDALTSNEDTWSKTVFFVTFDENDGLFDHMPLPAIPSYNLDGTLAGKSTVDVTGMYYESDGKPYEDKFYERELGIPSYSYPMIDPRDTISGLVRPWGMGPRVPMYVISPWSRGGWVNSQTFDHTSVGQFIEKRFGVTIPAISPWSRAVAGDLTTAFNFVSPNDPSVPTLPDMSDYAAVEAAQSKLPAVSVPATPQALYQEPGTRNSRALPYELHTNALPIGSDNEITLMFGNTGQAGAVFHVYDKNNLDRIPRRYTVEAGKTITDTWTAYLGGNYDLEVYGPNGYFRSFRGNTVTAIGASWSYLPDSNAAVVYIYSSSEDSHTVSLVRNAYRTGSADDGITFAIPGYGSVDHYVSLSDSGNWYDFSLKSNVDTGFERRFAGRMETGADGISDPEIAIS